MESIRSKLTMIIMMVLMFVLLFPASGRESPFRLVNDQTEGGVMQCWEALSELRACTSEIILFFINGETYLGQGCCTAIRFITHECWPKLLSSFGFTVEEANILRGYCDAVVAEPPAPGDGGSVPPIGNSGN